MKVRNDTGEVSQLGAFTRMSKRYTNLTLTRRECKYLRTAINLHLNNDEAGEWTTQYERAALERVLKQLYEADQRWAAGASVVSRRELARRKEYTTA